MSIVCADCFAEARFRVDHKEGCPNDGNNPPLRNVNDEHLEARVKELELILRDAVLLLEAAGEEMGESKCIAKGIAGFLIRDDLWKGET